MVISYMPFNNNSPYVFENSYSNAPAHTQTQAYACVSKNFPIFGCVSQFNSIYLVTIFKCRFVDIYICWS